LGDGALSLLFLNVLPAVYNTLSLVQFIPPVNLGPNPVISPGTNTEAQITDIRMQYANTTKLYKQYSATAKTLKQPSLHCVRQNKSSDLEENDKRMKTAHDINLPIETFFDQIEDAIEFVSAGNVPFTPVHVVNTDFNVISSTGMFQDDYKLWKRKPDADKAWTQFKIDFTIAHSKIIESAQTAHTASFQANNTTEVQRDTAAAISNLANATQLDRASMALLTTTITHLTTSLAEANEKLVTSLTRIAVLERDLATSKGEQTSSPTDGTLRSKWGK